MKREAIYGLISLVALGAAAPRINRAIEWDNAKVRAKQELVLKERIPYLVREGGNLDTIFENEGMNRAEKYVATRDLTQVCLNAVKPNGHLIAGRWVMWGLPDYNGDGYVGMDPDGAPEDMPQPPEPPEQIISPEVLAMQRPIVRYTLRPDENSYWDLAQRIVGSGDERKIQAMLDAIKISYFNRTKKLLPSIPHPERTEKWDPEPTVIWGPEYYTQPSE